MTISDDRPNVVVQSHLIMDIRMGFMVGSKRQVLWIEQEIIASFVHVMTVANGVDLVRFSVHD